MKLQVTIPTAQRKENQGQGEALWEAWCTGLGLLGLELCGGSDLSSGSFSNFHRGPNPKTLAGKICLQMC